MTGATDDTDATLPRRRARRHISDDEHLAGQLRQIYRRFVAFHSDYEAAEAGTLALWTLHTYVYQAAEATPYLLVTAATAEAGKSRVFDVAACLVHAPYRAVDPTPAALFNAINDTHPTVLIDETDQLRENRQLTVVLNAGFEPGTPVRRADKQFDVFCPKAFSGIAAEKPPVSRATLSRCIRIPMRRRLASEPIERFNRGLVMRQTAPYRDLLRVWAGRRYAELEDADPDSAGLTDRQLDCWRPLLAIADVIGGPWPESTRHWAAQLTNIIEADPDPNVQVLADVRRVLDDFPGYRITARELADRRNGLPDPEFEDRLSSYSLGRRLAGLGIRSVSFRQGGAKSKSERGYVIRTGEYFTRAWSDAFERYRIGDEGPSPVRHLGVASVASVVIERRLVKLWHRRHGIRNGIRLSKLGLDPCPEPMASFDPRGQYTERIKKMPTKKLTALPDEPEAAPTPQLNIDKIASERLLVPIVGTSPLIVHRFPRRPAGSCSTRGKANGHPRRHATPKAEYEQAHYPMKGGRHGLPASAFKQASGGSGVLTIPV